MGGSNGTRPRRRTTIVDNILRTFSVVASQRCVVVHSATLPPHANSPVLILGSNGRIKRRKGPNEDSDPVVRVSILGNLCLSRIGSPAVPRMWKSKARVVGRLVILVVTEWNTMKQMREWLVCFLKLETNARESV